MKYGLNYGFFGSSKGADVIFDGGMFVNGGFENGISNWKLYPTNGSWTATPGESTAQNIPNTPGTHFYQDYTLQAGVTYEISADQISGDGTVTYCINTADSGVAIADGPHRFLGVNAPESIGVTMSVAGTTPAVVDNLRLVEINFCTGADICLTVGKNPLAETYGYAPHAGTPFGDMNPPTFMGIPVYNFIFNAVNGVNACSLGVAGNDKIQDIDFFSATFNDYVNNPILFVWDNTQTRYRSDSLILAEFVRDNLGLNIGVVVIPSTFALLEDCPYWTFRSGASTSQSKMSWADKIVSKDATTGGGEDLFVSLDSFETDETYFDMSVSCRFAQFNAGVGESTFPLVVRAIDHDNFIGLRSYNGHLDVYEREHGTFRPLNNSAFPTDTLTSADRITLKIEGQVVTVLVNDISVGVYNSAVRTETGYVGIVQRAGVRVGPMTSNYQFEDIRMNYIGGNVPSGGSTVYLAFDRDVGGDPLEVIINVNGSPAAYTTFDITGQQIVLGMTTNIAPTDTVTATINGLGSNVPDLTDAPITNASLVYVEYIGELVTYNGDFVTYTEA